MLVDCTNTAPPPVPTDTGSSSGGDTSGGCGAATPYCAAYDICLVPSCPFWCQPASAGPACDTTQSAALVAHCGGATIHDGCDAASTGSSSGGTSSSGGQCVQAGLAYCAACDVCLPSGCAYWCLEGTSAACSTAPSGLTGCTGPIHAGCDCVTSGSSSGTSSGGSSSSGGGPSCTNLPPGTFCPGLCTNGCTYAGGGGSSGSSGGGTECQCAYGGGQAPPVMCSAGYLGCPTGVCCPAPPGGDPAYLGSDGKCYDDTQSACNATGSCPLQCL
jgi:hypothetical protein